MHLNCYSKMAVKFAVSVLNETTAKFLQTFGTIETSEAAKYYQFLDQFFDCLDKRSLEKSIKRKPYHFWNRILMKMTKDSPGWQISSFHILMNGKKILKTGQVISLKMLHLNWLSVCKQIMKNISVKMSRQPFWSKNSTASTIDLTVICKWL